jgi:hypothetical protein
MMANNNALTELQLLEGIYEHLSIVEELSKNMTTLSGRVRKVEERLMEPMEITNPILKVGNHKELTRNDSIYGAVLKSSEACRSLDAQKVVIDGIKSGVQKNGETISNIWEHQLDQKWILKESKEELLNVKEHIQKNKEIADRRFKIHVWMLGVLMVISITGLIL